MAEPKSKKSDEPRQSHARHERTPRLQVFGAPGTKIVRDGRQEYVLNRFEPYATRLGEIITLAVWETQCWDCDEPFEAKQAVGEIPFNRRCEKHRLPGRRVVIS